ncbi:MAG TPA: hypothetical protein V6C52_09450 [Coleofasciculaceae cyanobacterium]|jgi:hypothetical protein
MTSVFSSPSAQSLDLTCLPKTPLYGGAEATGIGWQLSPTQFALTQAQVEQLHRLGELLNRFVQAVDNLYRQSRNPNLPVPGWVADLYDQGKPEDLLKFSQMKRMKSQLPLVLRPDLLLREDGWTLCEIDAVPGGIGFTSALNRFYRSNGLPVIEAEGGMPGAFLAMLKALVPEKDDPVIAIVLSDEAADYRAEMAWLVETLRQGTDLAAPYENIALIHPKDVDLVRDRLVFTDPVSGKEKAIDLIYRFFELFDLPNIPKMELIQYAVKKGFVKCTPPFKPQVEEKLSLALLHHPVLAGFWRQELGEEGFEQLKQWVPQGWILDPTPLPPQAIIPDLTLSARPVQDFRALKQASQKERELVVKPSGFSELGWGSRGVTIGHDYSAEDWAARLETALNSFGKTPYILQQFVPSGIQTVERLELSTSANGEVTASAATPFKARTRLCPYYFVKDGKAELAGVLATSTPADKKLIHGMKDAVLAPCRVIN